VTLSPPRTRRPDVLGVRTELPFTGRFYPLGFPLDLATNSADVIEAAEESWSGQRQEFEAPPLTMRVVVRPEGPLAQPGAYRKIGHLYSTVSDPDNFAHLDLRDRVAAVHVSQATASDHVWLRWFYVESLAYLMLNQREVVMVHSALVARDGCGVMLCGPSTAGKSTLAYACARAGWTFLSDDCAALLPDSAQRMALGRPRQARFRPDAAQLFPELEGYAVRVRPTGKLAFEVDTSLLAIRTSDRAPVGAIMFLERGAGTAEVRRISEEDALDRLFRDLPCYGEEVDELHERTVRRVAAAPAYRLRYNSLEDGIRLLSAL
jgi:hypothetical protein